VQDQFWQEGVRMLRLISAQQRLVAQWLAEAGDRHASTQERAMLRGNLREVVNTLGAYAVIVDSKSRAGNVAALQRDLRQTIAMAERTQQTM
jgi:hypothetical protein